MWNKMMMSSLVNVHLKKKMLKPIFDTLGMKYFWQNTEIGKCSSLHIQQFSKLKINFKMVNFEDVDDIKKNMKVEF